MASPSPETIELSLPLPKGLDTRIYIHLTARERHVLLFLTTATPDEASKPPSMGSFVYALPNRYETGDLSTPLYREEANLDFANLIAKMVARKTQLPTYVGNSLSFASTGMGGTVEEQMEVFKKVMEVIQDKLKHLVKPSAPAMTNRMGGLAI